jgi:PleD family two-component response regulator
MRAADEALYQAKEAGRDRVVIWSAPTMSKLAAE